MAWCNTTALAGAVPCFCVRSARGSPGGLGPLPGFVSFPFPPSHPAFSALRVAGRPVRMALTLARWYAIPCGLCVPRAWSGCPSGTPRVPLACLCARALATAAPFLPPRVSVARAHRVVPVQGTGRAVPCGPCPSAFPASVPCAFWLAFGGGSLVTFPPCLALGRVPTCARACASGLIRRLGGRGGGGAACVPSLPGAWPGVPVGRGVALPWSVPLPFLGRHQSGSLRRRSDHGGRGPHTALVRVRMSSPGVVRGAPLCGGAGLPACRGHSWSRRWRPGGVWRTGLVAFYPGAAALLGGGGGLPWPWVA